jgi:plastocyanin
MRRLPVLLAAAAVLAVPASARADKVVTAETVWRFDASTYTIAQGEALAFHNDDQQSPGPHNVTAMTNGADGKPLFASQTIPKDQTTAVDGAKALQPGRYGFECTVHPFMQATLVVTDAAGTAAPSAPDTTAPRVRAALRSTSVRSALAAGRIFAAVTSSEAATLRLTAVANGVTIARAAANDAAPGRAVHEPLSLTAAGRRLLRRVHRLRVTLRVVAADVAGNAASAHARRTLKR